MAKVAPFGCWKSPITSDLIVAGGIGLGQIALEGQDVYWVESRPEEGGRCVIVRRSPDGQTSDVTPPGFNVRTRVHEYGGGAFTVVNGVVYFSNFEDQRLYRQEPGAEPRPIRGDASGPNLRYADGAPFDQAHGGVWGERMVCVREDHTDAGREAVNTLVCFRLDGEGETQVLVSGNDFYSSPRISPDGKWLSWLTWNHPNMPWDGTELWAAQLQSDGSLGERRQVAGGVDESVFQPQWSPDGVLYFVSDRSGWWNLYRARVGEWGVEPLCEMEAEFGLPQWSFDKSTCTFESARRLICTYIQAGSSYLASLDTETLELTPIEVPFSVLAVLHAAPGRAVFIGGSPTQPEELVQLDLDTGQLQVLRRSAELSVDAGYLTAPRAVEFPTENGLTAHAFFYPPQNRDFVAPPGERPPLIVISHGGPTGASTDVLSLKVQYWTSRGFAVLDVNYGGSSDYGRAYRQRLNGQWGVVDVDDCANGARYLAGQGLVDGQRLIIRGGSAGGYTTLCALTFRDVFKAGASYYGIGDLEALARDTHKFESRYLDRLVGPYPQRRDLYRERSPINFTERLACPVIFLQGLDDMVVPPNQAEMMVQALRDKGIPVAFVPFEGEQHGFRRAESIKRALDAELYFYSRVFGFELAEPVEPITIENLA